MKKEKRSLFEKIFGNKEKSSFILVEDLVIGGAAVRSRRLFRNQMCLGRAIVSGPFREIYFIENK